VKTLLRKAASLAKYAATFSNWVTAASLRYRAASLPSPVRLNFRDGRVLFIDPSVDKVSMGELFIAESYAPCAEGFSPKLVWDIGGNIGCFPLWASTRFPGAQFVSFEPCESTFQRLARNQESNPAIAWKLENFGLSSHTETCTAFVTGNSGETSRYGGKGTPVTFELRGITDYWIAAGKPKVDLLKIDCEGGEYKILEGADDAMMRTVDRVAMEVHPIEGFDPHAIYEKLERLGFEVKRPANLPGMVFARNHRQP